MIDQVMTVALTLWLEFRGEAPEGREGCATVIWNRMTHEKSAADVCLQRFQFSCWNHSAPWIEAGKITREIRKSSEWRHCWELADQLVTGRYRPVSNWTHYYNPTLANPPWAEKLENKLAMGRHIFGRLP